MKARLNPFVPRKSHNENNKERKQNTTVRKMTPTPVNQSIKAMLSLLAFMPTK